MDSVDSVFRALADPTRRDIVLRVLQREHSISELATHYAMSFTAVQKHVAVLERATLVRRRRVGREARIRGDAQALRPAAELLAALEQIWIGRLHQLGDVVASLDPGATE